jgi:hypothetical protein
MGICLLHQGLDNCWVQWYTTVCSTRKTAGMQQLPSMQLQTMLAITG